MQVRRTEAQSKIQPAYLKAALHAAFILTGAVNTMLGPLLPLLSGRWSLSDAQAGLLFAAQFGGSVSGVLLSTILVVRGGHRLCLVLGLGLMATGAATLLGSGYQTGLMSALSMGIGLGLAIPTTNLLVSGLNPQRRAAALSLINLSWGAGAVGCPFFIAALLSGQHVSLFLDSLAALLIVALLMVARISFPSFASSPNRALGMNSAIWRSRWIPILGAMFFLYVGSEGAVSGWIATYAKRILAGPGASWVLMPSVFWVALLLGRALVPLALRRMKPLALAKWGLRLAAAGVAVLLMARSLPMIAVGTGIAGLGFSPAFPVAIASLGDKFGEMESRVAGVMFALAGCGGAALPWLAGYLSTAFGGLRFGLLVPLGGCGVMLALNTQVSRRE
jgi:fucose permease